MLNTYVHEQNVAWDLQISLLLRLSHYMIKHMARKGNINVRDRIVVCLSVDDNKSFRRLLSYRSLTHYCIGVPQNIVVCFYYIFDFYLKIETFYKIFERDLLVMFFFTFPLQIFSLLSSKRFHQNHPS